MRLLEWLAPNGNVSARIAEMPKQGISTTVKELVLADVSPSHFVLSTTFSSSQCKIHLGQISTLDPFHPDKLRAVTRHGQR